MEGMFWIALCLLPVVLGLISTAAAALVIGILVLLWSRTLDNPRPTRVLGFALLAIGAMPLVFLAATNWRNLEKLASGRLYFPQVVTGSSAEIAPMLEARRAAGAEELGFTPIEPDASIEIERTYGEAPNYDVMLHVDGSTSRTIAFKQEGQAYRWVGEQETFTGPKEYLSGYSYQHETLSMTFDTVTLSGAPLNHLHFMYRGEGPRLKDDWGLTYDDVFPILVEWGVVDGP